MDAISLFDALSIIDQSKLHPFRIGFTVGSTGKVVDLDEAILWRFVKHKIEYVVNGDGNGVIKLNMKKIREAKNNYYRLIVDTRTGKTYNVDIDLVDRFNNKEVF